MPGSSQEPGRELLKSCLGALLASRGALRSHPWVLWALGRQGAIGLCPGWPCTGLSSLLVLNGPGSTRGMRSGGQSAACPPWPQQGPGTQPPPPSPPPWHGPEISPIYWGGKGNCYRALESNKSTLCCRRGQRKLGEKGAERRPPPKAVPRYRWHLQAQGDGIQLSKARSCCQSCSTPTQHHESRREFGSPPRQRLSTPQRWGEKSRGSPLSTPQPQCRGRTIKTTASIHLLLLI